MSIRWNNVKHKLPNHQQLILGYRKQNHDYGYPVIKPFLLHFFGGKFVQPHDVNKPIEDITHWSEIDYPPQPIYRVEINAQFLVDLELSIENRCYVSVITFYNESEEIVYKTDSVFTDMTKSRDKIFFETAPNDNFSFYYVVIETNFALVFNASFGELKQAKKGEKLVFTQTFLEKEINLSVYSSKPIIMEKPNIV